MRGFIRQAVFLITGEYIPPKITARDMAKEIIAIEAEQKHRRMYETPPPFSAWSCSITGKSGSNYKDIMRWYDEHYDWLENKENV